MFQLCFLREWNTNLSDSGLESSALIASFTQDFNDRVIARAFFVSFLILSFLYSAWSFLCVGSKVVWNRFWGHTAFVPDHLLFSLYIWSSYFDWKSQHDQWKIFDQLRIIYLQWLLKIIWKRDYTWRIIFVIISGRPSAMENFRAMSPFCYIEHCAIQFIHL